MKKKRDYAPDFILHKQDYQEKISFLESLEINCNLRYAKNILWAALEDKDILVKITASDILMDGDFHFNKCEQEYLRNIFANSRSPVLRRNIIIVMAKSHCKLSIHDLIQKLHSNKNEHVISGIYLALIILGRNDFIEKYVDMLNASNHQVACFIANSIPEFLGEPINLIKHKLEKKLQEKNVIAVQEAVAMAIKRVKNAE